MLARSELPYGTYVELFESLFATLPPATIMWLALPGIAALILLWSADTQRWLGLSAQARGSVKWIAGRLIMPLREAAG